MFWQGDKAKKARWTSLRRLFIASGLLMLVALWGAACSPSPQFLPPPTPDAGEVGIGLCETNRDCLDGQVCLRRYCQSPGGLPGNQVVSLHVLPPSTHRYSNSQTVVTTQQFLGVDASKIHDKAIFLRAAYLIDGQVNVTDEGSNANAPVAARIRFIDRESIAGTPVRINAESDANGRFKARLTHGLYDVEITPTDGKHPPHRISGVKIERDGGVKLTLPADDRYPRLSGRIVTPDTTATPVAGLRIQVFSATDRIVSSVAVTDEKGVFNIWLSAKERPHRIRIYMRQESREDKVDAHPQIDLPFAPPVLSPGEKIDLGDLKVGFVLKSSMPFVSGSVHATQQHAAGQPLKGCEVHLIGTIDLKTTYKEQPIVGYYRVTTTTKEGGAFRASILPGSYQIDVLPPIESRELWARASIKQDNLLNSKSDFQIHLQPKPKITGRICQKGDKGQCVRDVAEAQIQAVWRNSLSKPSDPNKRPPVPVPETPTQLSESKGWYTMPLDPGVYDLIFVPPMGSGLARRIRFNVRVEASDKPQNIDAYLKSANHLAGVIFGPDRFPIPNTIIEMYSHPNDPTQPVRLLGRATTNSAGKFSLAYDIPSND